MEKKSNKSAVNRFNNTFEKIKKVEFSDDVVSQVNSKAKSIGVSSLKSTQRYPTNYHPKQHFSDSESENE